MNYERSSGILMHPTSLTGPFGIGDIGPKAYEWVDYLNGAGMGLWQVLPLGPTGYADSPYQCFSAFAGNANLISPELLLEDGLVGEDDLKDRPDYPGWRVNYGEVIPWKGNLLRKAFGKIEEKGALNDELRSFEEAEKWWLDDYALFMALKEEHEMRPWTTWEAGLRDREKDVIEAAKKTYAQDIERHKFIQFVFFKQWRALKAYTNDKGIKIIGDMPIYVAHDSADVWVNRKLFYLDEGGNPTVVAGVPPDYFSETGQLWGNPLYRWDVHAMSGYAWWVQRLEMVLGQVDMIRLDHFRGFAGYWEVPAEEKTAKKGKWVTGPGENFFSVILERLGDLPILAEDLGEITPDVIELRDQFGLPGMKILQFGFDGDANHPFLPDNYPENSVAYTGTHDNETATAWYENTNDDNRHHARTFLDSDGENIAWDMLEALWASDAVMVLAPMQDFLVLGINGRMNYPGTTEGNWAWRIEDWQFGDEALRERMAELNRGSNRG